MSSIPAGAARIVCALFISALLLGCASRPPRCQGPLQPINAATAAGATRSGEANDEH
jgi:hypothetical protein